MPDITTIATNLGREASAKARTFAETNPVAKQAKDAVYTAVGFTVLGAQRTTKAVKGLQGGIDTDGVTASLKKSVEDVTATFKRQATWLDQRVDHAIKTIDGAVAPIEAKLPSAVRDAVAKARETRSALRAQVVARFAPEATVESTVETPVAEDAEKSAKSKK